MEQLSKDGSKHITDERINTITSLAGSMIAIVLSSLLIGRLLIENRSWYEYASIILYCVSYINLFVMSTLHHGLKLSPRGESVFRTLDYTAIFWVIGGTITALVALSFNSPAGIAVLIATWLLAATGITLRSSLPKLPKHITNTLFIVMGWLPAMALISELGSLSASEAGLLAVGGLVYTFGFIVYVAEKPNPKPGLFGFHELWHILVIIASFIHWILIYKLLA